MSDKNHLDELREYQEKQYLPHNHHIQKGELPFATRQMMKQGGKKKVFLFLLAVPVSLCLIVMLNNYFALPGHTMEGLLAVWVLAVVAAAAAILASERRRIAAEKAARNAKKPKRKKK